MCTPYYIVRQAQRRTVSHVEYIPVETSRRAPKARQCLGAPCQDQNLYTVQLAQGPNVQPRSVHPAQTNQRGGGQGKARPWPLPLRTTFVQRPTSTKADNSATFSTSFANRSTMALKAMSWALRLVHHHACCDRVRASRLAWNLQGSVLQNLSMSHN